MHPTIKVLKQSLSYAKFPSNEINQATRSLINDLGDNLEEHDYEQPPFIDQSASRLQTLLNEYDDGEERRKQNDDSDDSID